MSVSLLGIDSYLYVVGNIWLCILIFDIIRNLLCLGDHALFYCI